MCVEKKIEKLQISKMEMEIVTHSICNVKSTTTSLGEDDYDNDYGGDTADDGCVCLFQFDLEFFLFGLWFVVV